MKKIRTLVFHKEVIGDLEPDQMVTVVGGVTLSCAGCTVSGCGTTSSGCVGTQTGTCTCNNTCTNTQPGCGSCSSETNCPC